MPCYSPLHGYMSKSLTANGKRKIVFSKNQGYVDMPVTVPCGHCIGCRIERSRQWAIRCVHEAQLHATSCFVTLTYNDDNLPDDTSVHKEDLQKFFKRLRKSYGRFRYFACGEYGDESLRPHYHAIIFGLDFSWDRKKHSVNKRGDVLFKSQSLTETWGLGHALVSSFSYATAAYTARYIMKKIGGEKADTHYQRVVTSSGEIVQVEREFSLMSLKPGIGSGWYEKFRKDVFPSDFLVHEGKKHSVPRFYADKLKKEDEKCHSSIKMTRKKRMKDNASENTPDRLWTKEQCKSSQIIQLKRNL